MELRKEIINYLISKGKVRACLLHKLIKQFCTPDSKHRVSKVTLILDLLKMMQERTIDIMIPEPFDVDWEEIRSNDFKYLKHGLYKTRKFSKWNNNSFTGTIPNNEYLFDSREFDLITIQDVINKTKWLKMIIKKIPKIKYKIMVYYPKDSKKINIYETLAEEFQLECVDINPPPELMFNGPRFEISIDDQRKDLGIIQAYRTKYMCLYITLIESIQNVIVSLQKRFNFEEEYQKEMKELVRKFGYYCMMFVRSDWVEISKGNPYKWETFFISFDLPFEILNLEFITIKFYDRTFETVGRFRYCIYIEKNQEVLISRLKNIGYQEFKDANTKKQIAVGFDHESFVPCPSIEHFFFIFKYICYYHLFLLFHHSFDYICEIKPNLRFNSREKELYKHFFPLLKSMFNITENGISKTILFKFYTLNPTELEVLYNNFMVSNIKTIETKLFKYFMIKYSLIIKENE